MPVFDRRVLLGGSLAVAAVGVLGSPAAAAGPAISGTDAWKARPASGPIDVREGRPVKIIVHHTATDNSTDTSLEHAFALCRDIQNLHMDTRHWIDTGQNFTNTRGGHLLEGRHSSLAALGSGNRYVVGTHAGEQNQYSLGIENEGLYSQAEVPQALWNSLVTLCRYMAAQYGIAPGEIYGHRDFMPTVCPGDALYRRLPELRRAVAAASARALADPVVWPLLQPGVTGPKVAAAQWLLRAHGAEVPAGGVFDAVTQRAATEFAARHGLVGQSCSAAVADPPGVFGGSAWAVLVLPVAPGSGGDAVRAVQVLLTSHGHHTPPDGKFGNQVALGVRGFQRAQGLPVTGAVDRATWKQLLA